MNAKAENISGGHYTDGLSNEDYHSQTYSVSTSVLKTFMDDPALVKWGRAAKQDMSKLSAIDFGKDFHLYFLESELFNKLYRVLPVFNRRKPAEKQEELDLIDQWRAEGTTPVTSEDFDKCKAMRDSALAHPTVAAIMELDGIAERSYFWTDPKTGVNCKCRPDWLVLGINDDNRPMFMEEHAPECTALIMDVKSIGRFDRLESQIEELKYYVQDDFYTRGVSQVENCKVCFVFVFVSTTLSMGRHPVQVVMLSDTAKFDGKNMVNDALRDYAQFMSSETPESWQTVKILDRPYWATREEDVLL